jgi:hypothetical protein
MLSIFQPGSSLPIYAARQDDEGGGNGWLVFSIMIPLITLVGGYIVGRTRGHKRGKKRRTVYPTRQSEEEYEAEEDWYESV